MNSTQSLKIDYPAQAVLLIQKAARYTPKGKLIGIAVEREEKDSSVRKALTNALITFDVPPAREARASDDEYAQFAQALREQFIVFAENFSIKNLGIVWFSRYPLRSLYRDPWLTTIISVFRDLRSWAEQHNVEVSLTLTDYDVWADGSDFSDGKEFMKQSVIGKSGVFHSYTELLESDYGQSLERVNSGDCAPQSFTHRASQWAERRASPNIISGVKEAYVQMQKRQRCPPAAAWNNVLRLIAGNLDDVQKTFISASGDAAHIGMLLAQLSWQHIRDRIILYALHPQLNDISGLSQRQIVRLMGDASELLPDSEKAKKVTAFLAYLAVFSPDDYAMPYAMMAYIQWWLGEGSAALASVEAARKRDSSCSMARLVEYALKVQLPPPWVDRDDKDNVESQ